MVAGDRASPEKRLDVNPSPKVRQLASGTPVFLGLDLAKASWHVTARARGETLLAFACPSRPECLLPTLHSLGSCVISSVYEAGPFGYTLHDWLVRHGVNSMVCSPAQVPVEVGNRVKTDRRDSLKLATTLEAGLLRPIAIPTLEQRADRELVRQRDRLVRRRRVAMVQIRGFLLTYGITPPVGKPGSWGPGFLSWLRQATLDDPQLQATFASLRRGFEEADAHLRDHTKLLRELAESPRHSGMVALLSSAPGIGWLGALTFSVEVFDWSRFKTGEAFSAFLGLTPSQHSSGERVRHGGITHAGNARLRSLLVESSWTTLRADADLRRCYEVLRARRGGKRAIVAIARRMCHRLLAMVRSGECYRREAA